MVAAAPATLISKCWVRFSSASTREVGARVLIFSRIASDLESSLRIHSSMFRKRPLSSEFTGSCPLELVLLLLPGLQPHPHMLHRINWDLPFIPPRC